MVLRFTTPQHGEVNLHFFSYSYATHARLQVPSIPQVQSVMRVIVFHQQDNGVIRMTPLVPSDVRLERDMTRFHHCFQSARLSEEWNFAILYNNERENVTIAGMQHVQMIRMVLDRRPTRNGSSQLSLARSWT